MVPFAPGPPRDEDCLRFGEPRQEVEVRAGPVFVQHIAVPERLGGRRQQQQAIAQSIERALAACEKVAQSVNRDPAWRGRLLEPVEMWGIEGLSGTEALIRLVVRAEPGPGAPEAARELRRRIIGAVAETNVRLGAREITIQPAPPEGGGSRPDVTA